MFLTHHLSTQSYYLPLLKNMSHTSEHSLIDDWGFYIDIEAHDWNQVGTSAPIKIQVKEIQVKEPEDGESDKNRRNTMAKEEIQRHIAMSSPKQEHNNCTSCFNDILKKTVSVVIIAAVIFY